MNISNTNAIADFDNLDRKQVSVNTLKCNNINVNVNGLELDVFSSFLSDSGLSGEAADGSSDASSFVGNSGSETNNFRFICINNNNNTVIQEEPVPPLPPAIGCEDCFINNLNNLQLISVESYLAATDLLDLEGLCDFLSNPTTSLEEQRVELERLFLFSGLDIDTFFDILECLEDIRLVIIPE